MLPAAEPVTAGVAATGAGSTSHPLVPRPFRVVEATRDTVDTVTLTLEAPDGEPLRFTPGQFTMVSAFGVGEVPLSISGDPARPERLVHTVRDVGGVTKTLAAALPGSVLGVRGPYGTGWGVSDIRGGDVVLVAGGIGLAPLRPALYEVIAERDAYGSVSVLVGARTPDDLLYGVEADHWRTQGVDVRVSVDRAAGGWTGRVGLVTSLVPNAALDPANALALVCGPEPMMRYAASALGDRGVPPERVRVSLERHMPCGVGLCGHCQLRELFVCRDGPVLGYDRVAGLMATREL